MNEEGRIPFSKLLKEFMIPEVHYDIKSKCPSSCSQQENCEMIKGAYKVAHTIVDKLKSTDSLLAYLREPILVGSLKENSRVFHLGKLFKNMNKMTYRTFLHFI